MKTQKSKAILLSLVLTFTLNNAHAQSLGGIFGGIKDRITEVSKAAIDAAREKASAEDIIIDNSLLDLSGTVAYDDRWVMILIKKDNYKEQLIIPVNNGLYQTPISLQDGPGLYSLEIYTHKNSYRYSSFIQSKIITVENTDPRDMRFLLPTIKVQSDDVRITMLVESLTKNARNDEEAFLSMYKYVTSVIKYDYDSVTDGSYVNKDFNAINTLLSSLSVCEGYANLLAAMSRAYGIRAKVIFGQANGPTGYAAHAWNEVFIDNEWKIVDPTWDAILKHQPYLFIEAGKFSLDHTKETETKY